MILYVSQSIDINTNAAQVWRVLTTPALIKGYLLGTETVTDWQVGHPIFFRGEYNGQSYEDRGTILECELNRSLRYTY